MERINAIVQTSFVGRFFKLEERGTNFMTELGAATATFMTMAYILAVNPRIQADSGGPCEIGEDFPAFLECVEEVRRQYVTATALGCCVGCLIMGLLGNLPIAQAPGMGVNAYFTYDVVGFWGSGAASYAAANSAVLLEGVIFLILAMLGIRKAVLKLLPEPVVLATPAAIGAFLAHLGLQTANGIGVVVTDVATSVTLGGCPEDKRTPMVAFTEACQQDTSACIPSDSYTCDNLGGQMTSATTWMGIIGTGIILLLLAYKKRWAFLVGIGFVTVISWFRDTAVTFFPDTDAGNERFEYFKQIAIVQPVGKLVGNYSSDLRDVIGALITFLYIDFLGTLGTFLAVTTSIGIIDPDGNFPQSRWAYAADALATMFGSVFGLSPVTSYIESAAGVEAGGRTGLTAVLCAFYFFLSIFFAPIIASIPPWATGGALVVVGALMCKSLGKIQWQNIHHAITAFVTVILMPLTYSIAYGLVGGIGTYILMLLVFKGLALVGIAEPTFEVPDDEPPVLGEAKEVPVDSGTDGEKGDSAVEDVDVTEKDDTAKGDV